MSFVQSKLRNARYKFRCWKHHDHVCNGQRKSWFSCSVSRPIAPNVDMAWYPEKMIVLPLLARWL